MKTTPEKNAEYGARYRAAHKEREKARKRKYRLEHRAERKAYRAAHAADPKSRYCQQKSQALRRGISWEFTFETWWIVWRQFWWARGKKAEQLCMSRPGDTGPYSPSNTKLITNSQNSRDAQTHAG